MAGRVYGTCGRSRVVVCIPVKLASSLISKIICYHVCRHCAALRIGIALSYQRGRINCSYRDYRIFLLSGCRYGHISGSSRCVTMGMITAKAFGECNNYYCTYAGGTPLSMIWRKYESHVQKRPLLVNMATSATLWAAGDMLSQRVQRLPMQRAGARQTALTCAFGGLVFGPMGYAWYQWLDIASEKIHNKKPDTYPLEAMLNRI